MPSILFRGFYTDRRLFVFLRGVLGFAPGNISVYKTALRHKSAAQEIRKGVKDSNERLEFLGDAILSAVVADYLYKRFPFKDEGFLTKLRSRMVSRENVNELSRKMALPAFIESNSQGQTPPRSMDGDAMEALIGAVFLDKGYRVAEDFILNRMVRFHIDMEELEFNDKDYKSRVIEWAQRNRKRFSFEVIKEGGTARQRLYEVQLLLDGEQASEGRGISKKAAEQAASEVFLRGQNL